MHVTSCKAEFVYIIAYVRIITLVSPGTESGKMFYIYHPAKTAAAWVES